MFEHLNCYSNIVVSGPQRSGTRIAAKIVAADTGKIYVDERNINFQDFRLLEWYLEEGNVVVQCPGLCHMLHYIDKENTLVTIIYRPIDEILSSEARAWSNEARLRELYKYGCSEGVISEIKYAFWRGYQRPLLGERTGEINYYDLKHHPLFVDDRTDFRWDQTS